MDPLKRLTDIDALAKAWDAKSAKLTVIDAEALAATLKSKVIGQDEVIDQIARTLKRRLAAKRPNKPVAVFCFAGSPGVGKTYLAKVMADAIFKSKNHLHHIDMSAAGGQGFGASNLFGSPKGYTGSGSYGSVTAALRDVPDSIMLLDEFEKASPETHKRFLTAWNDGFVTEASDGAKIATNETIFVLTTNAASRRIGEMARGHKGTPQELDKMIKSTLGDAGFAPEVLSRIDNVFAFQEMKGLDIARVVALLIEDQAREYGLEIAEGGIDTQILLGAIDKVVEDGAAGGVREIARAIEGQIADGLVDAKTAGATKVRLVADGDLVEVIPVDDGDDESGEDIDGEPAAGGDGRQSSTMRQSGGSAGAASKNLTAGTTRHKP
jgi:ATP-dependent Clp protease ATP-binding subunit ClpA